MNTTPPTNLIEQLVPEVVAYSTPQFALKEDLENLNNVQHVSAPEAMSLYCARILEALVAAALEVIGLSPSPSVFSNLNTLQQYNLLPTATRYWAHALRRLGNDVRHIHRRIKPEDATLAVAFIERFLDWFFCYFRYGYRLPSLTHNRLPLRFSGDKDLQVLMERLDDPNSDFRIALEQLENVDNPLFLRAPVLPAVLAEMLLGQEQYPHAYMVLNEALEKFPNELRLSQLTGLYWSRTGNLMKALETLEPLYAQFKDDDETAGIMAGVYKRLWSADNRQNWLEKSHRAYLKGWERSREANAYLGINAATTALWLDQPTVSKQLAEEVRQLLRRRADALAAYIDDPNLALDYWDHVTQAEAELLVGEFTTAQRTYRDAFEQYPEQRANIQVSQDQANQILEVLGHGEIADTFWTTEEVSSSELK